MQEHRDDVRDSLVSRMRSSLVGWRDDDRGSVTIQVVFFSLMVFGTTGVVLDAGRVYDAHLQMQAYADQMALAAANELDGQVDSIERATNAVFGFGGAAMPFLEKGSNEGADFEVASVSFFSSMNPSTKPQNDMTEAFPITAQLAYSVSSEPVYNGDPENAARSATHAVVKIKNVDVSMAVVGLTQTIMNLGNDYYEENKKQTEDLGVSTVAAAQLHRHPCADLSTLVLCNPWEYVTGSTPLDLDKDDPGYSIPGRSLAYFAPNHARLPAGGDRIVTSGANHGSPLPWDVTNQIFKLQDPIADPGGICSGILLAGLPTEDIGVVGSDDYLKARDRCLMARSEAHDVCWSDDEPLTIAPADGDTVVRSINTIFDIWMPPFKDIIEDANLIVPGLPYTKASFFQPDRLAMTAWETADRYGDAADTDPLMQDGTADYNSPAPIDDTADPNPTPWDESSSDPSQHRFNDIFQGQYDTIPAPGWSFRTNLIAEGYHHDYCHDTTINRMTSGSSTYDSCTASIPPTLPPAWRASLELNCGCSEDFVGDWHEGNIGLTETLAGSVWSNMYDIDPTNANHTFPTGTINTWYDFYKLQRERQNDLVARTDNSRVMHWSNRDDASTGVENLVARYGLTEVYDDFVKKEPMDFLDLSNTVTLLAPERERRRIRAAFVNCGAVTTAGTNDAGTYDVPVDDLRVMDVYVPEPAGFFCGPNDVSCSLEDSIETRMFVELIDDKTDDALSARYTAQLVR